MLEINSVKITIITVVLNAVESIEYTLSSVISQTYSNIELIVIDGLSIDGTQNIIQKYIEKINHCIIEKDNGIYDAMNKGIKASSGDWILFLNAGDIFFNNNVLFDVQSELSDCDIVYGKTAIKQLNGNLIIRDSNPIEMDWKVMPYCHQSVFIKKKYLTEALFDINYKIAADFNQYFLLKSRNLNFKSINIIISIYNNYGVSSTNNKLLLSELKKVSLFNHNNYFIRLKIITYFFLKNVFNRS